MISRTMSASTARGLTSFFCLRPHGHRSGAGLGLDWVPITLLCVVLFYSDVSAAQGRCVVRDDLWNGVYM